ncbi:response regulator transcription factor [Oceanobacillus kimchii]|uniref:DNA-binding response regulator n=1 Tax=Oceanobacillus kimchii TaxID=746691 RepID=A0ABQ5TL78_9BACI|nr:response regulator transcription factor [Oceanobacillus kimchii]GLO67584.1 DNA-binding response regulator [Oceanobacillus kimchii]
MKVLLVENGKEDQANLKDYLKQVDTLTLIEQESINKFDGNPIGQSIPDMIIIHEEFIDKDTLQQAKKVKQVLPNSKIILIYNTPNKQKLLQGMLLGLDAVIPYELFINQSVETLRIVQAGATVFPFEVNGIVSEQLKEVVIDKKELFQEKIKQHGIRLTKREVDIAYLLMTNHTNLQIASKLFLGEGTVKNYISEIYNKLNIHNRSKTIEFLMEIFQSEEYFSKSDFL